MNRFYNSLKTAVLLAMMFGLILLVGSFWGRGGLTVALFIGLIMNGIAWFFSDKIAVASMRGREVDATTAPDLYNTVDRLRQRAGLPMPRVYLCPHEAPNAFATGRSPSKAAVAVTDGLLRLLDQRELEGVIAHELAHIKNRDTLTSTIAATIAGALAYVSHMAFWFGGFSGNNREGGNPLLGIVGIIIAPIAAAIIQSLISRTREYSADADGSIIAGSPVGLAGALHKLDFYARRIPLDQPNPAQNNLFIVEPFCGIETLTDMFATHPPVEKRIAALEKLRQERELRGIAA